MYIAIRIEIDDWTGLIDGAGPTQVRIAQVVDLTQFQVVHTQQCFIFSKVFDLAESLVVMFAKRIEHHHAHR